MNKTERLFDKNSYAITRGHDFVEINGVKWATCDLGAEYPDDFGYRFAWGSPKIYDAQTMRVPLSDFLRQLNEYRELSPNNDPAHILWGGKWRTPTRNEAISLGKYIDRNIFKYGPEISEKLNLYGHFWVMDKNEDSRYPSYFSFFGGSVALLSDFPNYTKFIRPVLDV